MSDPLIIAIPSKGRLMEDTQALFERAGFAISRTGAARGYRGMISNIDNAEIAFLSSLEIAQSLHDGSVDLGVTGEDLLHETLPQPMDKTEIIARLGFGPADIIVAVPDCWLDVTTMRDLDEVSIAFYETHRQRLRVATKYPAVTRRFFAEKGVSGYRIVESLGATEGAPAAGSAEIIVDITTTGSTLKANHLRVLDDGVILKSQAVLAARKERLGDARVVQLKQRLQTVLPN